MSDKKDYDDVEKSYHYNICGDKDSDGRSVHEPIKVIEAWGLGFDFCLGNAIKYILRAKFKGTEEKDLRKALWYLERSSTGCNHFKLPSVCTGFDVDSISRSWNLSSELRLVLNDIACLLPSSAAYHLKKYIEANFEKNKRNKK